MNNTDKNDMTVSELARIMDKKFDGLTEIMISGFDRLEKRSDDIESDVEIIKSDVGVLKSDVGTLKSDVGTLKSDVGTLKSDVGTLKSSMIDVQLTQRKHTETLAEHSKILHRIEGDVEMLIDRDLNHETRIGRLEKIAKPI